MRSVLQYHQGRCHSVLIMLLIYRWIYIDKPTLIKQGPVALRWHPAATMTPLIAILSLIDQLKSHWQELDNWDIQLSYSGLFEDIINFSSQQAILSWNTYVFNKQQKFKVKSSYCIFTTSWVGVCTSIYILNVHLMYSITHKDWMISLLLQESKKISFENTNINGAKSCQRRYFHETVTQVWLNELRTEWIHDLQIKIQLQSTNS